jgi:hypothetical protein
MSTFFCFLPETVAQDGVTGLRKVLQTGGDVGRGGVALDLVSSSNTSRVSHSNSSDSGSGSGSGSDRDSRVSGGGSSSSGSGGSGGEVGGSSSGGAATSVRLLAMDPVPIVLGGGGAIVGGRAVYTYVPAMVSAPPGIATAAAVPHPAPATIPTMQRLVNAPTAAAARVEVRLRLSNIIDISTTAGNWRPDAFR